MRRSAILILLVFGCAATGPSIAATPARHMLLEGFLKTDGEALDGNFDLTFALYAEEESPEALWSDTLALQVVDGFFQAPLGTDEANPITVSLFEDNPHLWIGIQLGAQPEFTRTPLETDPYAFWAERAERADAVDGLHASATPEPSKLLALDSGGKFPLAALEVCETPGEVLKSFGGEWTCAADEGSVYTAGAGIELVAGAFALLPASGDELGGVYALTCPAGEVMAGIDETGTPTCVADQGTVYDGTDFVPSGQMCPFDGIMRGTNPDGSPSCTLDQDTTYSGADFATSSQACAPDDVVIGIDHVGALVCEAGGPSGGLFPAKPFINRRASANTTSAAWVELLSFGPLTPGNFLTITNLKLEGKRPSCCCGSMRFGITYADGTSYTSTEYGCPGTSWTTMADANMPVFSEVGGTITALKVEGRVDSGATLDARLTISGFETGPSDAAVKPFIHRSSTANTTSPTWVILDTIDPLTPGNYIAITNLLLEGKRPSCCCGSLRFTFHYADGSSYTSSDYGCPGTSWTSLADVAMPIYANVRSTITSIDLEGYIDSGATMDARLTISGYENEP